MIDYFVLEDSFGKPIDPEVHEEQAERGDHSYDPKITWCKKPGQDHGGNYLDCER